MDHSKAIYISDMGQCMPRAALASGHSKYHWQTVPYEAEDMSGVLLFAGPATEAPPVTLSLDVSGWHAIFVGLYSNITPSLLKVKLTGDPAYVTMAREEETATSHDPVRSGPTAGRVNSYAIDERYWKSADLAGQNVVFAQQGGGSPTAAYVAYVKLVPLSESEVAAIEEDRRPNAPTKRLIFMNDGFSDFGTHRPTTAEKVCEWLEPMRDADFKTLFWGTAKGDVINYPSDVATMFGVGVTDYPREGDRQCGESMQVLAGKGVDSLRTVVDCCHSMGVDVHVSFRMEAFQCSPPFDEFFTGDVYRDHPEWRCVDIDSREIARMSYAFPEVRELVLSILREMATRYDIDGVNPIFNRGAPFLLYEEPLVEGFKEETGLDPRTLDERDARYLRYRAGVMTDFMRTLRNEMDEIGHERGRKLEISTHVLNNEETDLFYALDVRAWVEGGLIDNLISYPWRDGELDVEYFGRLTRDTPVRFYPEMMPRRMSPEEYRQLALRYYEAGADGLCFWDTNSRAQYRKEFSMIRRLGHRDDLARWDDGHGEYFRTRKLRSVGGYALDKYPPHWAY